MCGAAALPVASLVISAVGTGAQISQARSKAKYQESYYNQQAQAAETDAAMRREERARKQAKFIASQRAAYGAAGVELDGSPTDVIADTASEFAREQYADDIATKNRINSYRSFGGYAEQQGDYATAASLFNFADKSVNSGVFDSKSTTVKGG